MTRRPLPRVAAALSTAVLAANLTSCGAGSDSPATTQPSSAPTDTDTPSSNPVPDDGPTDDSPDTGATMENSNNQIRIRIGEQRFTATLDDSAAARDLLGQLPVTLDMVDHGGVEKTGPLPAPLSLDGQPEGADPAVGDLGYYAPGNDLVLYYGDQSYYPGIVVVGRLDGDAATQIAALDGAITATVETK